MRRRVLALIAGVACALAGLAGTPIVEAASAATATAAPAVPVGAFDQLSVRFDAVRVVSGWAASAGPGQRTTVRFYIGGQFFGQTRTGDARPDVAQAHPSFGALTGWHARVDFSGLNPVSSTMMLCAYGINPGSGPNALLGCQRLFPVSSSPFDPVGALDAARASPGTVDLRGWAGDPDGDRTTQIRIFVDGSLMLQRTAAMARPDVEAALPQLGPTTGFHLVLPVLPGSRRVCIEAQNTGLAGSTNSPVGCRAVAVAGASTSGPHDPRGRFDAINTTPGGGHLTYSAVGWAFDPDSGSPVNVVFRTFVDPFGIAPRSLLQSATLATGASRPDVQAAFPAAGPNAGFNGTIATTTQARVVYSCAYATNTGPGANRFLGCMTTPL